MIGEYLGEGDPESVATMHAFVDLMDFSSMKFTDALRMFLQSFRLPGEAQKIDRYMLKFAERFMAGNPSMFANAGMLPPVLCRLSVLAMTHKPTDISVRRPTAQIPRISSHSQRSCSTPTPTLRRSRRAG